MGLLGLSRVGQVSMGLHVCCQALGLFLHHRNLVVCSRMPYGGMRDVGCVSPQCFRLSSCSCSRKKTPTGIEWEGNIRVCRDKNSYRTRTVAGQEQLQNMSSYRT